MARVFHKERLGKPLARFVAWWEEFGQFDLTVPPSGGFRDDAAQLLEWAKGRLKLKTGWVVVDPDLVVTNAEFARDSAHGRADGAAGDFFAVRSYFANGNPASIYLVSPKEEPADVLFEGRRRQRIMANAAVALGYEAGLFWPHPDGPHIADPKWRDLPLGRGVAAS